MSWKPWLLPLTMGASLGAIHVLPKAGETAQSAVRMELPSSRGDWTFERQVESLSERQTLGNETDFAKATCLRPRFGEYASDGRLIPDVIDLSIVLSGSDLNTSIHRPERCMPAQGHTITESRDVRLKVNGGHEFEAKRLLSVKTVRFPEGDPRPPLKFQCVTYYFFVGRDRITNDHFERTLIDMKDRLQHGLDQRWAYVSATIMYGKLPWLEGREVTMEEADGNLREFLREFAGEQIDWGRVKG